MIASSKGEPERTDFGERMRWLWTHVISLFR